MSTEEYKIISLQYAQTIREIRATIRKKRAELKALREDLGQWERKRKSLDFHELFPEYEPRFSQPVN